MQMKVFPQTKLSWIYNLCNFREIWNDDGNLKNLGNNKTKKEERKKWNKILLLEIFLSGGIFWSSVSTGDFLKNLWDIRQALFSTQPLSNGRFPTKNVIFLEAQQNQNNKVLSGTITRGNYLWDMLYVLRYVSLVKHFWSSRNTWQLLHFLHDITALLVRW